MSAVTLDIASSRADASHGRRAATIRRGAAFAPAGYESDPERQRHAARYFASQGCRYEPSEGVRRERFAAGDRDRADELARIVADPGVDVAIALRGGYGSTRLLPSLDWRTLADGLAANGKRLVGHSDLTAIELALLKTTGAITFAGPMVGADFGAPEVDPFTAAHFWRAMREARVDATFAAEGPAFDASGTLWGGNLSMIASLVGTPWLPAIDGGVLFVEEVNERPYRIERMLLQLHQSGVLERQRAILCGTFSGWRPLDYDNGYDMRHVVDYLRGVCRVPIATGLPFGHEPRKLTLAVGAEIDVRLADGVCTIAQSW